MSDINFCNTKEQLNHLGEVVTGKVDGSPTGADIDTSTLPYTGQVRKTLPALEGEYEQSITDKEAEADAAIDSYRLLNKGPYASGIALESKFEYITYNGESYFATNPPYTTTATLPDSDGNLFLGGYTTFENVANKIGNTNLLSNHNFIIQSPDAITPPSATPEAYAAGTQIFSGVYAGPSGATITLINGRVNCTAGDYQFKLPNTGGLDRVPVFTSSVSDYDGIPKTTGVSHALIGDEYVVTVTPTASDVFGVKFEQGSVATRHDFGSLSSRNLVDYTDIVYKASGGNSAVENMVAGTPVSSEIGDVVSTGSTSWKRVANSGSLSDFKPMNGVWAVDFGVLLDGNLTLDNSPLIDLAVSALSNGGVVHLPQGYGRCASRIDIPKYVTLKGAGWSVTDQTGGTTLQFDAGSSGMRLVGQASEASNINLYSLDDGSGASNATGAEIRHLHCRLTKVNVGKFGGKGITVDSRTDGDNCNEFIIDDCRSWGNGSDGLFIDGVNSNAGNVYFIDCTGNGGTQIWCKGSRNFIKGHIDSAGVGLGGCYDDAIGNDWNVYVEASAGTGANFTIGDSGINGKLTALLYAKPTIVTPTATSKLNYQSWSVYDQDKINILRVGDANNNSTTGATWQIDSGISSLGTLRLRNITDSADAIKITRDGSRFICASTIEPTTNGTRDIGTTTNNYRSGYFVNTPVGTSDRNLKTDEQPVPKHLLDAALELKGSVKIWRWLDRVNLEAENEGGNARYHAGPIAQDIISIFEKHMPDDDSVWNYGFVLKAEDGKLMIRPVEILWLIIAAL